MLECKEEVDGSYAGLIDEVFIKPIRTVMVVDDEFPTVDLLLKKEVEGGGEWSPINVSRARKIIDSCRSDSRHWVVDIHDGSDLINSVGVDRVSPNFHHSDLLILDYHLDTARPNDGDGAISILRRLADNDHFNLVVVYTKGYNGAGGDISRVVHEIAVGLCSLDQRLNINAAAEQKAKDLIEEWSDDDDTAYSRLIEAVDEGMYLKIVAQVGKIDWTKVLSLNEAALFNSILHEGGNKYSSKASLILQYVVSRKQDSISPRLADRNYGRTVWGFSSATGINWIRNDRLFVTVVSKSEEPSQLPDKLLSALVEWNPEPHRLLMSKMRSELDERGVLAEDAVLNNAYLQAGWLQEYLHDDSYERQWKIQSTISRHWEGLGDSIQSTVSDFADRLATCLLKTDSTSKVVDRWYPALDDSLVKGHLNNYINSKGRVEGLYLTTGHVIKLSGKNGDGAYWLCLSPACDLVPGQKNSGWQKRLGKFTPFIAVELFRVKREEALSNAFSGNHIFLKVAGELIEFSFTPPSSNKGCAEDKSSNPKWEQMFVSEQGRFDVALKEITLSRAEVSEEILSFKQHKAEVVAHLRYEYALNLLARLGANLSRVGLDFVALIPPVAVLDTVSSLPAQHPANDAM